jgi:hypothetical protein
MVVGWPARGRTASPTSVVRVTGVPSIETKRSPGRSPAWYAGVLGSVGAQAVFVVAWAAGTTHSLTDATVAPSCGTCTPCTMTTPASRATAMRRFMVGPPSITTTFLGTDSL